MAERIVMLHGFTQTSHCWGPFADRLADSHEVVAVDLPGHGSRSDVVADLPGTAELLAPTCEGATVIGYSLGGRVALHIALTTSIARLVLISATGGIDDGDERAARRAADDALADHVEQIGVDRFLDEWLSQPLFASLSPAQAMRIERMANTEVGLASSLRNTGTGTQRPLWTDLRTIEVPTLVVTGSLDEKFERLGARLADAIGENARHVTIDGAGHSAQLERPGETADAVLTWFESVKPR